MTTMTFDSDKPTQFIFEGSPYQNRIFDINKSMAKLPSHQTRGIYHVAPEAHGEIYATAILKIPGVPSAFMNVSDYSNDLRSLTIIEQSYPEVDRLLHFTSIGVFSSFEHSAWASICHEVGKAGKLPASWLKVAYPLPEEHKAAVSEFCGIIDIHLPPIFAFPPLDPSPAGNRVLTTQAHQEWFADMQDVVKRQGEWNLLALHKKALYRIDQATMPIFINCVPFPWYPRHGFFQDSSSYPDSSDSEAEDFFTRKQLFELSRERMPGLMIYCGLCDGEHEDGASCSSLTSSEDEEMDELDPSPPSSPRHFNSPASPTPRCAHCGMIHDPEIDSLIANRDDSPFYSPTSPLLDFTPPPIQSPRLTYPLTDDCASPAWSNDKPSTSAAAATIAAVKSVIQEQVGISVDDPIDLTNVPDEITLEEWRAAAALAKFISAGRKGKGKAA